MKRIALVLIAAGLSSCGPPARHEVTYAVTGSARVAHIVIANRQGGTEMRTVRLPYEEHVADVGDGGFLYLSVQNEDPRGGDIACAIFVDGHSYRSAHSEGRYQIASCNGSAGDD